MQTNAVLLPSCDNAPPAAARGKGSWGTAPDPRQGTAAPASPLWLFFKEEPDARKGRHYMSRFQIKLDKAIIINIRHTFLVILAAPTTCHTYYKSTSQNLRRSHELFALACPKNGSIQHALMTIVSKMKRLIPYVQMRVTIDLKRVDRLHPFV